MTCTGQSGSQTERHRERKNSVGLQEREGGIKKSWQGARQGQVAKEMNSYCSTGPRRMKLKNRAWELEIESQRKKKLPEREE